MAFWNRESPTVFSTLSLTGSGIRSADHRSTASLSGSDIIPSNSEVCLLSISRGEVSPIEDEVVLCDSVLDKEIRTNQGTYFNFFPSKNDIFGSTNL